MGLPSPFVVDRPEDRDSSSEAPALSVVVVAYNMARELPRTLESLATPYQRGVEPGDYEVIVVDNGSDPAVDRRLADAMPASVQVLRIDQAPPSPARAANTGIAAARCSLVGLVVDGARMASPGLLRTAQLAAGVHHRPVIATLAWHLGSAAHSVAHTSGHDADVEDRLLADIDWTADGYRLFEVSTLGGSSRRGWFGPLGESSALFMPRELWQELGGLDEGFALPGGGLVNHDLFRRACALPDVQLVVLLGEGTFHQIHGGAATSRQVDRQAMFDDYERRRHEPYVPPANEPLYVGTFPPAARPHVEQSLRWAARNRS
jgi:hypothetical protein